MVQSIPIQRSITAVAQLDFLEPPGLVGAVPFAPKGDGRTVVWVTVVGQVKVKSRSRSEDPIDASIMFIGEDIPCHCIVDGMHWRVISDVTRADPEIASGANVPKGPLVVVSFKNPLLIISVVAVPAQKGIAVCPGKIKDGARLAVDEDVG